MTRFGSPFGGGQFILLILLVVALSLVAGGGLGIAPELRALASGNPIPFIALAIAFVLGSTIHEFMHAYVANRLGDATARLLGRLSLDPRRHFDPFGALFLLLFRFGWAKPTPVNYARLQGGRRGAAAVAFAGPATNFVLAAICALPFRFGAGYSLGADYAQILAYVVFFNVLLGVFNLIPIPPLDGSNIVYAFVPANVAWNWGQFQQLGPFLLLLLFWGVPFFGQLLSRLVVDGTVALCGLECLIALTGR